MSTKRKVAAGRFKYMLGIVLLWIVVYLSGMLICKICGEKETSQMWKHLIGFFFLVFCQGVVFFGGQLLGWSFSKAGLVLTLGLLLVSAVSLLVCRKDIKLLFKKVRSFSIKKAKYPRHWALLVWLFLGIILVVAFGTVTNRNDAVVETAITTLMTDSMNVYHPFTRSPMEAGIILSRKLITLPFWYSMLSVWTGLEAVDTVWILGTLITAVCSLLAFGELAGLLFFRDFRKTWLLIVLIELLYLSGDYSVGAVGYRQLFYGYSGEVIVSTVIIPCVLSILYRFWVSFFRADFSMAREKISLWAAIVELGLCIGCCLFLTPLIWGVYMAAISIVLFVLSVLGVRLTKRKGVNKV